MRIVIDENILYGKEIFSLYGDVISLPGRKITNKVLKHCDALIVRSVTQVDKELLSDTDVKFVGTATIGKDHIDESFLNNAKIFFTDAKGCNANAVAEYTIIAILNWTAEFGVELNKKTIGIIGYGNIGSLVKIYSDMLGLETLINDPPLEKTLGKKFSSIEDVLSCDIVTLHVPLTFGGEFPTYKLLNEKNFQLLKPNTLLINTSRGGIIDEQALLNQIKNKNINSVIDVWTNEPNINLNFLKHTYIATPHIAGYSYEGKLNGTKIIHDRFIDFFNLENKWIVPTKENLISIEENNFVSTNKDEIFERRLVKIVNQVYNPFDDTNRMKKLLNTEMNKEEYFDNLRKNYPLRKEFSNYKIFLKEEDMKFIKIIRGLGFNYQV